MYPLLFYLSPLFFIISCTFATCTTSITTKPNKIVGLVQARNEADIIEQCLRSLAVYTDAIVLLDDNSCDKTALIAQQLSRELTIEHIIKQPYSGWEKTSESANRQTLLDAGRAIGGTHFILIDADELFMAPCSKNIDDHKKVIVDSRQSDETSRGTNWLRTQILTLKPGQYISFPMVNVWGNTSVYRDDKFCSPRDNTWRKKPIIFYDDGKCSYLNNSTNLHNIHTTNMLHASRIPRNLLCWEPKRELIVRDINHGIIHFKWVNFENILNKKIWYMMLEYIRAHEHWSNHDQNKIAHIINNFYNNREFKNMMPEEQNILLKPVPKSWYDYPFFDATCYTKLNQSRQCDIARWLETYGTDYFSRLDLSCFLRA